MLLKFVFDFPIWNCKRTLSRFFKVIFQLPLLRKLAPNSIFIPLNIRLCINIMISHSLPCILRIRFRFKKIDRLCVRDLKLYRLNFRHFFKKMLKFKGVWSTCVKVILLVVSALAKVALKHSLPTLMPKVIILKRRSINF